MAIVMTKDGLVRPLELEDLTEVAERDKRIAQLEALNATLAAQIDRMTPVVDAVLEAFNRGGGFTQRLATACDNYVTAMAALAKGTGE